MFSSLKILAGAAGFAALTLMGAGSANAVPVDIDNLVADFGNGSVFVASDQGDLDSGPFSFGSVVYDGSLNLNGKALTTQTKTNAQASAATANGFTNGFVFNTHSLISNIAYTAQPTQPFPGTNGSGFINFQVTFFNVTGLGTGGSGTVSFTDAELSSLSAVGSTLFTDSNGQFLFTNATLPIIQALAGFNQDILALVSGTAFSPVQGTAPSYIVDVAAVPLPAPLLLFVSALFGLGFLGRRRLSA